VILTLAQLQDLLRQAGWPDTVVNSSSGQVPLIPLMASIGMAESGGNTQARNTSGEDSVGIWQINRRAHPEYTVEQLQDPLLNATVALRIYNVETLRAWGAYTDGSYRTPRRGDFEQSLALYNSHSYSSDPLTNTTAGVLDGDSDWQMFPTYDGAVAIYQEPPLLGGNFGLIAIGVLSFVLLVRLLAR